MLARNQIDRAQYAAGRKWQQYHERAAVGTVKAVDPSKTPVDGGKIPEPLNDRQVEAVRKLNEARKELGAADTELIYLILGERWQIRQVAAHRGKDHNYIGKRFRDALETLATLWGLASRSNNRRPRAA
jgi:hypothetical protein